MKRLSVAVLVTGALTAQYATAAQVDAGALLNQYRQTLTGKELQLNQHDVQMTSVPIFQDFAVENLSPEAEAMVKKWAQPYKGQHQPVSQLVQKLERYLQDHGQPYVFQVQGQDAGIIKLQAIQVHFGKVVVDSNQSRSNSAYIEKILRNGVAEGKLLDRNQLERNASILNEIPGLQPTYKMQPGADLGSSDLHTTINNAGLHNVYLSVNNYGINQLGKMNLQGSYSLTNAMGLGDVTRIFGLASKYSNAEGVDFSLAPFASGLRLGANFTHFSYDYDRKETLSTVKIKTKNKGLSNDVGVYAIYPWVRSEYERRNLTLNLDHLHTTSDALSRVYNTGQFINDNKSSIDINKVTLGVEGVKGLNQFWTSSYQLSAQYGHAKENDRTAREEDKATADRMGSYGKFNAAGALSRNFDMAGPWVFTFSGALQVATTNLPNAERYYLGGNNRMRAWAPQTLAVDDFIYGELKLERLFTDNLRGGLFLENIGYRQNAKNYTSIENTSIGLQPVSTSDTNRGHMTDIGLQMVWSPVKNLSFAASVARKLGATPNVGTSPLSDSKETRGWMEANLAF